MNRWGRYVLWVVGMFVLLLAIHHFELVAQMTARETYRVTPELWTGALAPFVFGVYLSLLLIKGPIRVNLPLLVCVFLPSFILAFYMPIAVVTGLPVPLWMSNLSDDTAGPTVVAGLSLMASFFGK